MKRRVLFVCTANSARSLMAEALLRHMAGDDFEVASAGSEPTAPHPLALRVLAEQDIPIAELRSKSLSDTGTEGWDYVITLCEKAARECGTIAAPAQQIAWDFPDPVPGDRHARFVQTLRELRERIALFTLVHQKRTGITPAEYDPVAVFKALGDDARLDIVLLIRDRQRLCVNDLVTALAMSQPKVSRHLATLREVGLLVTDRRGQWVYYSLNPLLPPWLARVLDETAQGNSGRVGRQLEWLEPVENQPITAFNTASGEHRE